MKKIMTPILFAVAALTMCCAGCKSVAPDAEQLKASSAKLEMQIGEIVKGIQAGGTDAQTLADKFVIQNPAQFFKGLFGEETGWQLGKEYEAGAATLGAKVAGFVGEAVKLGRTDVRVRAVSVHSEYTTPEEAGALGRMKNPAPLYTAVFEKPGDAKVSALWFFVEENGEFRIAGKMEPPSAN